MHDGTIDPFRDCDERDDDHFMCGCITLAARQVTKYVLGTNCTFADDDIKALGILADKAIRAGLHHEVEIPASLIAAIDYHLVSQAVQPRAPADTHPEGQDPAEGLGS